MNELPKREVLIDAAMAEIRDGVSPELACLVALSAALGERLDPFDYGDAAVLHRAELLMSEGVTLIDALAAARAERPVWSVAS